MNTQHLPIGDELLVSVFAQFEPRSSFRVSDEGQIISAFHKLKRSGRFDALFANYAFDEDGLEPRSRAISEAVDALQQSRLLGRMNPDLVNYSISPGIRIRYSKFIEPKLRGKQKQIEEMAKTLQKELKIEAPSTQSTRQH